MIYKIESDDIHVRDVYVGSTTDFVRRKNFHKKNCSDTESSNYNSKIHKFIRENGGWDHFEMVLVAKTPCDDKSEALSLEKHYSKQLNATLNNKRNTKIEEEEEVDHPDDKYIKCIYSLLLVGSQYVSLKATDHNDVPIFFTIKSKQDDNITIEIVNCTFYKNGDGNGRYSPNWQVVMKEEIFDKDLWNIMPYDDQKMYYAKTSYMQEKIGYFQYYRPEQYKIYQKV